MVKKDEKQEATVPATPTPTPPAPPAPNYDEKFKSFEETITKQGETIDQLQDYVTGSSVVINTIAADPQLRSAFQESFKRQYGIQTQQPSQNNPPAQDYTPPQNQNSDVTGKVDDVVSANRKSIIRDFETRYGIDQMKPEEAKVARQKIATYLGDFGWEVEKLPLTNLRDSLDKAYMGSIGMDKLREEGRLEGVIQTRTNEMGTFGSMSGSAPNSMEQTGELSPKQMEWLKKLKIDPEGAKKLYQDRENEQDREKVVEK